MNSIPLPEVQKRFLEIVARVEAGETMVVTRDGKPVLDLTPHQAEPPRQGGINWEALEAYKKAHGVTEMFTWDPETFDDPISDEEFLTIFEPGT